jgi:hypothetical protein
MKKIHFLLFFISLSSSVFCQLNNQAYEFPILLDSGATKTLEFKADYFGYFKNNEYFGEIVEGRTYFGQQLHPKISYQPTENVLLEAGLFVRQVFGENRLTETKPTFSLKYQKNKFGFLLGNLEGSLQHGLIEPLYDFERVIDDRLENGIQFLHKGKRFTGDWWINWRKSIQTGSTDQEEIEGAGNMKYKLVNKEKTSLEFILQSVILHRGGQINSSALPVYTTMNNALGIQLNRSFNPSSFAKGISMQFYTVGFSVDSDSLSFRNGNGLYLNGSLETSAGTFIASYWKGEGFVNILGGDIYSSVSRFRNFTEPTREILVFRWLKDFQLSSHCQLSVRAEPYYDFQNSLFEYSIGVYANYRLNVKIPTKQRQ